MRRPRTGSFVHTNLESVLRVIASVVSSTCVHACDGAIRFRTVILASTNRLFPCHTFAVLHLIVLEFKL